MRRSLRRGLCLVPVTSNQSNRIFTLAGTSLSQASNTIQVHTIIEISGDCLRVQTLCILSTERCRFNSVWVYRQDVSKSVSTVALLKLVINIKWTWLAGRPVLRGLAFIYRHQEKCSC